MIDVLCRAWAPLACMRKPSSAQFCSAAQRATDTSEAGKRFPRVPSAPTEATRGMFPMPTCLRLIRERHGTHPHDRRREQSERASRERDSGRVLQVVTEIRANAGAPPNPIFAANRKGGETARELGCILPERCARVAACGNSGCL